MKTSIMSLMETLSWCGYTQGQFLINGNCTIQTVQCTD